MSLNSFLHTVKWFQVLLYSSHNLTSVICLQTVLSMGLNRTNYQVLLLRDSGPGSNAKEGVLHILQISNTEALSSGATNECPEYNINHIQDTC